MVKKINLKQMLFEHANDDLVIYKKIYKFMIKNRFKLYLFVIFLLLPVILLRIPYVNLYMSGFINSVRFLILYFMIIFLLGFETKKLYLLSFLGLIIICALVLIGSLIAEELANTVFLILLTAIITDIIKNKNVLQKPDKKN